MAEEEKIDPDMLFKNFYKADPARRHSSTGLGLSIAKGLSEKMNGQITAEIKEQNFIIKIQFPLLNEHEMELLNDDQPRTDS